MSQRNKLLIGTGKDRKVVGQIASDYGIIGLVRVSERGRKAIETAFNENIVEDFAIQYPSGRTRCFRALIKQYRIEVHEHGGTKLGLQLMEVA